MRLCMEFQYIRGTLKMSLKDGRIEEKNFYYALEEI